MSSEFKKNHIGIRGYVVLYICISLLLSLTVYSIAMPVTSAAFEKYVSDPKVFKKLTDNYFEEFQAFATANRISSTDGKKIAMWNKNREHVSMLISDEEKMIYNSFISYLMYFDDDQNRKSNPSNAFEWGTKAIPVYIYYVKLSDETAKIRISGYLNKHYDPFRRFLCITLMLLSFVICFTSLFRIKIKYIKEIQQGILSIKNGHYTHSIPIRGHDELAELSENINILGETIDNHLKIERGFQKKKDQFVRSIAHDIRTPLTSVMAYLEMLQSTISKEDQKSHHYLSKVYSGAIHINELIDDLFKIENEDFESEIRLDVFDGAELLSQLIADFTSQLEDQGIGVEIENKIDKSFDIYVNINYIMRIWRNLSSNIFRYADKNHPVTLATYMQNDYLYVSITNTILVNPSVSVNGSGIGLKSCKTIMELHFGSLETHIDAGQFSTVLKFPVTFK